MVSIYLIEDLNDLKYIGSTTKKLYNRMTGHRYDKRTGQYCSSSELNLYNCIIIELERCDLEQRKERERYWINNIDCVNQIKYNGRDKDKRKEYNEKNKEKRTEQHKEWCEKNKEKIKEKKKEYQKIEWFCSHCKCSVKLNNKAQHLKTKKHQLNINNYLSQ